MVQFLFSLGPCPDLIHFESGSGSGFYPCNPDPDFINCESESESGFLSGPDPDFIHF